MKRHFTSDHHFGHVGIIGHCGRPFGSLGEMHEAMIDGINSRVSKHDRLYVLGDFVFGGVKFGREIRNRIRCQNLILIEGNHDRQNHNFRRYMKMGFSEVHQVLKIKIRDQGFMLSHFPYLSDRTDDRYKEYRITHQGIPLLCGHVHNHWKTKGDNQINVGVDVWDYKPVDENTVYDIYMDMRGRSLFPVTPKI